MYCTTNAESLSLHLERCLHPCMHCHQDYMALLMVHTIDLSVSSSRREENLVKIWGGTAIAKKLRRSNKQQATKHHSGHVLKPISHFMQKLCLLWDGIGGKKSSPGKFQQRGRCFHQSHTCAPGIDDLISTNHFWLPLVQLKAQHCSFINHQNQVVLAAHL